MARCEDYPCCGHTDGLPCDWTPPDYSSDPHLLCDHAVGVCDVYEDDDDDDPDPDSEAGQEADPAPQDSRECVIKLASGRTIRTDAYPDNPGGSSYVRVCDRDGREVAYWSCDEWAEDPQLVMGAILGAANGTADRFFPPVRTSD